MVFEKRNVQKYGVVLFCVSAPHLHGTGLVVAYEGRPPLDGNWLGQRNGAVRLVAGEVLQAAGVRLLLSVLPGGGRSEIEIDR